MWRWVRRLVAVVLLVAGAVAAWSRRGDIHQAIDRLGHPAWVWIGVAVACQASSMIAFARLQRWLLRCGGVRVPLRDMVEITLAGNALSTSLPGGAAWAAGWAWGQLRRRAVDRVLAGWVVLVAGALASFALFLLVVVGAFIAGGSGPVAPLRWLALALLLVGLAGLAGIIAGARWRRIHAAWRALYERSTRRSGPGPWLVRTLHHLGEQMQVVTPSVLGWLEALGLALYNWASDLATLIFCIWAVRANVPWRGIVVAYALTQISASVPITPGGLAVVEASLVALLTAYGMPATTAVTVVLLYRLISFWFLVPIGWGSWIFLEVTQRRGGPPRRRAHPWAERRPERGSPEEMAKAGAGEPVSALGEAVGAPTGGPAGAEPPEDRGGGEPPARPVAHRQPGTG